MCMERQLTAIDRAITVLDEALRLSAGVAPAAARRNPAVEAADAGFGDEQRRHVAGLMRINHTGEICAQALYAGQAVTARDPAVRDEMAHAAAEEIDHLAWCAERLEELDSHTSALNPLWYAGSFAIGAVAGMAGDPWSLGFVRETEQQVEAHLEEHIRQLPEDDHRSRAILAQMKTDEARHAAAADAAGARDLPEPVRQAMRMASGVMKKIAYRV